MSHTSSQNGQSIVPMVMEKKSEHLVGKKIFPYLCQIVVGVVIQETFFLGRF